MKAFLQSAALSLASASLALAKTKHVTLDVVNAVLAPDGFPRSGFTFYPFDSMHPISSRIVGTVVVNGTYPGPPILAEKGDTLVVTVNNKLVSDMPLVFYLQ